ncbi:MAG: DUF2726 domain-containing protein [Gammaproteobacteria bacterium]|nr:DUF2726 domain-containing protein [Gammaproteobacteria bacterium]MCW8983397.1 DUF2726 domain-containing protein [Gammaproteobacteria bacterium]
MMFGLFKSKPIQYKKRISVISRNQRSLYKLVQNVLQCNYAVIPGCPAYRVIDVADSEASSASIKKGKKMVDGVYFDLVVIESDGFRPICAFRMDPRGNESEEHWDQSTKDLIAAADSAKLPLFIVPVLQAYDTFSIVAKLRKVIPEECLIDKQREYMEEKLHEEKRVEMESDAVDYKKDPWTKGGGGRII